MATAAGATGVGIVLPLAFSGTAEAAPLSAWETLAKCESNGNWRINTGNGYSGGLQFAPSTWKAFGGDEYAPVAHLATKEQQIAIAEKVLAAQGPDAWAACAGRIAGHKAEPEKAAAAAAGQPKKAAKPQAKAPGAGVSRGGGTYTVKAGDTLAGIAERHGLKWQQLYAANKGQIDNPGLIRIGQKLVIPGKATAKPAPAKPAKPEEAKVVQPVDGHVTADYRQGGAWARGYHSGVDFAAAHGAPVEAAARGVVVKAGWNGAFGNQVVIEHRVVVKGEKQLWYSSYSHLSSITATPGTKVKAGTQIGTVGSTGNSTGPHVHFELGTAPDTYSSHINPYALLRGAFTEA
ncbi:transglycosylase family protein [Streptomyces sp. NPDC086023]|uniref:transglycosylase family protein n=1 Tax=Streptomyces sp. NPDC086023 TaxID=3365746 RepID=UPI0037D2B653